MATVRRVGDVQVVEVAGDVAIGKAGLGRPLDLHGRHVEDLGDVLRTVVNGPQPRVVLDLRRVNFIDSAGIGDLVAWKKRALVQKGDIKLLVGPGPVRRILDLLDLGRVFETFEELQDAVDAF